MAPHATVPPLSQPSRTGASRDGSSEMARVIDERNIESARHPGPTRRRSNGGCATPCGQASRRPMQRSSEALACWPTTCCSRAHLQAGTWAGPVLQHCPGVAGDQVTPSPASSNVGTGKPSTVRAQSQAARYQHCLHCAPAPLARQCGISALRESTIQSIICVGEGGKEQRRRGGEEGGLTGM